MKAIGKSVPAAGRCWRRHYATVHPHGLLGERPSAAQVFAPRKTAWAAALPLPTPSPALAPYLPHIREFRLSNCEIYILLITPFFLLKKNRKRAASPPPIDKQSLDSELCYAVRISLPLREPH
jgi:hypothetical protein